MGLNDRFELISLETHNKCWNIKQIYFLFFYIKTKCVDSIENIQHQLADQPAKSSIRCALNTNRNTQPHLASENPTPIVKYLYINDKRLFFCVFFTFNLGSKLKILSTMSQPALPGPRSSWFIPACLLNKIIFNWIKYMTNCIIIIILFVCLLLLIQLILKLIFLKSMDLNSTRRIFFKKIKLISKILCYEKKKIQ